jgi:uncharacterized membrane protein YkvA (DUF1232 family)
LWWLLISLVAVLLAYAAGVGALIAAGRHGDALALVRFIPDCVLLVRRLIGDSRVPRRTKAVLGLLVGYLVLPFDLVPDFIPVAGQLDDAIITALVLRYALRSAGEGLLREHWPGPDESFEVVRRMAFGRGRD